MSDIFTRYALRLIKKDNPEMIRDLAVDMREITYLELTRESYKKIAQIRCGEFHNKEELNNELEQIYKNIKFLEHTYSLNEEIVELWDMVNSTILELYSIGEEGEPIEQLGEMEKEIMKSLI